MRQRKQIPKQTNAQQTKAKEPNYALPNVAQIEVLDSTHANKREQHKEVGCPYRLI
jgi:hypothetical protein